MYEREIEMLWLQGTVALKLPACLPAWFQSMLSRPQKSISRLQSNTCSEGQMSTMSINRALKPAQRSDTSRADKHTSNKQM